MKKTVQKAASLLLSLLFLLALGVPIAYSIGIAALTAILPTMELDVSVVTAAQRTFVGMSSFSLTAIPFFILAGNLMNQGGIAKRLVDFVMALLGLTENKYLILLIMNVILLVAGTFMDVTPAILIFTPLFLPIVKTFGMHPVHFGLILVYNLCIGNITPPVGNTLFVSIKVGRTTLAKTIPYMLWYYAAILVGLLLVTYLPVLSMGLPGLAGLV